MVLRRVRSFFPRQTSTNNNLDSSGLSFSYNNVVLKASLNKINGLHLCLLNINGIRNKVDELNLLLEGVNMDVICLTESKINQEVQNSSIAINGFHCYRNDRPRNKGGGVCVYIKRSISGKVISCVNEPNFEVLFLELNINSVNILLCVVYRPPKAKNISDLHDLLLNHMSSYNDIILCGDFNYDLLKNNSKIINYRNMLDSLSLEVVNTSEPTHFPALFSPSLLDHVITNNNKINFLNQLSVGFTNHDFIYFSYDVPNPETFGIDTLNYRDFNYINYYEMFNYADSLPWHYIYNNCDPEAQLSVFNELVRDIFENFVPVKTRIFNNSRPRWLTNTILFHIELRNFAYHFWKRNKCLINRDAFKRQRNYVTYLIRKAKNTFLQYHLNPDQPSKQFWKKIKNLEIGKAKSNSDICFSVNELNDYFCHPCEPPIRMSVEQNGHQLTNVEPNEFSFKCVTHLEFLSALGSVTSNAVGFDEIPIRIIKILLPIIEVHILFIYNNIITTSKFPNCWKHAKIIPLNKVSQPKTMSDFRPISILPAISKVFEKILQIQITGFIEHYSLIDKYQSAYRKFHSTSSAVLSISDDILRELNSDKCVIMCLLDFSKAFDTIDHIRLEHKLKEQFHFHSTAVKLVSSYLTERFQTTVYNNNYSDIQIRASGVPQGSVLGPILFSLYVNDIVKCIKNSQHHMYADDVQLYHSGNFDEIGNVIESINEDLKNITLWSVDNGLHLNANKTQTIILGLKGKILPETFRLRISNKELIFSHVVKDLGLYIDDQLSWSHHVDNTCKTINFLLRQLWSSTSFASTRFRNKMFNAFILPHFIFCATTLFSMDDIVFNKLRRVFHACVRYVFDLRKFDHLSGYKNLLLGCSLEEFFEIQIHLAVHNILKTSQPKYLSEKLIPLSSSRLNNLALPPNKIKRFNKSFFVRGVSLWNSLPACVKSCSSSSVLKKELLMKFMN